MASAAVRKKILERHTLFPAQQICAEIPAIKKSFSICSLSYICTGLWLTHEASSNFINTPASEYFDSLNSFQVSDKKIVVIFMMFFALSSCIAQGNNDTTFPDTCKYQRDTTLLLNFSLDTAKNDFYDLLSLIESKGEFSRFSSENTVDSSTANHIILKKILCWEKFSDSPVEFWRLNNIFSISYFLGSTKSTKEKNEPLPSFRVTQLNFTDNKQMEVAATKILEVHWGEPLLAWNFWFLIKGNRRIYILQNYVPGYIEVTQRYMDIIQQEWVNKNVR